MMSLLWAPYRRETANLDPEEKKKHFEGFESLVRQAHREFESAKQSGTLSPDPLGVAMFRALRLGKGAISVPLGVKLSDDGSTAHVRSRLITNLDNLQLDSLPTGVRVYLMGYPLGRLEMIAVGYQDPSSKDLLGSVDIDWSLSRAPEGMWSPAGWLIESIAADPSTAAKWVPGRKGS